MERRDKLALWLGSGFGVMAFVFVAFTTVQPKRMEKPPEKVQHLHSISGPTPIARPTLAEMAPVPYRDSAEMRTGLEKFHLIDVSRYGTGKMVYTSDLGRARIIDIVDMKRYKKQMATGPFPKRLFLGMATDGRRVAACAATVISVDVISASCLLDLDGVIVTFNL